MASQLSFTTIQVLPPRNAAHVKKRVCPNTKTFKYSPRNVRSSARLKTHPKNGNQETQYNLSTSALRQGIRSIAVGKLGEKPLPPALIPQIHLELQQSGLGPQADAPQQPPTDLLLLRASFLGALFMKVSLNDAEFNLLHTMTRARSTPETKRGRKRYANDNGEDAVKPQASAVTAGEVLAMVATPKDEQIGLWQMAFQLLCNDRLSMAEARALGQKLYADEEVTPTKTLIAHVMRVRHETAEELGGLAQAIHRVSRASAGASDTGLEAGAPRILLSEPFDGTMTWDLLTPLVARHMQEKHGLACMLAVGENSGPKPGPNLLDLTRALRMTAGQRADEFGRVQEQRDVHGGIARWTHARRVILKRPALATVEKYADGGEVNARCFIASAFHPGYVEKMGVAAEAVGFAAYVIVGKGMEGSIGLGIGKRVARLLVGWCTQEGGRVYGRRVLEVQENGEEAEKGDLPVKGALSCEECVQRTLRFCRQGTSGNAVFDRRVRATTEAVDRAIAVIRENAPHVFQ